MDRSIKLRTFILINSVYMCALAHLNNPVLCQVQSNILCNCSIILRKSIEDHGIYIYKKPSYNSLLRSVNIIVIIGIIKLKNNESIGIYT